MKVLTAKLMTLLGLLVIGATAAYGSQTDEPKMNGKLRVGVLSPEKTFYTGKPYNKDLGAYLFNYRNYDPQIARWTTPDPSGFPDGANNSAYVAIPTYECDYQGLKVVTISDGTWWFSVNYKLSYDAITAPSLVGDPWLGGITNIPGVPAGYDLKIGQGVLQDIQKVDLPNEQWKYTGTLNATVHLNITFGIKIGPITVGPGYEDSVDIVSNWEVLE